MHYRLSLRLHVYLAHARVLMLLEEAHVLLRLSLRRVARARLQAVTDVATLATSILGREDSASSRHVIESLRGVVHIHQAVIAVVSVPIAARVEGLTHL